MQINVVAIRAKPHKCAEILALESWCCPPQLLLPLAESWVVASMLSSTLSLLAIFGLARASAVTKRQATTTLSSGQIEAFKPYTLYAATAYCDPSQTLSWSCGGLCLGRSMRSRDIGVDLHDHQISARVTPPFNLMLLAVTGRMSSSVRSFRFLNYYLRP